MTAQNDDAAAIAVETPGADASAQADAAAAGSQADESDTPSLRSRFAGQTAKVNQLTEAQTALQAERDELRRQLDAAQKGELDKDQALKDQLTAKDAELAAAKTDAALARIEAKYPETFAALGNDAAVLNETKLAEIEARLSGGGETEEPPTPRSASAARPSGSEAKPETAEDVERRLKAMPIPW